MNDKAVENVIWVITDGRAGILNQARGLAEAIGLPIQVKTVRPRLPWTLLPPTVWPATFASLGAERGQFVPPWPRVAVGCGWRSIPFMLAVKKASNGRTFTVQLQHPRVPTRLFDAVVPPEHDNLAGDNVIPILGSPNGITRAKLDEAAAKWRSRFDALPRPRVAVLIGGKSKSHSFNDDDARALAAKLKSLLDKGCGVMATTSRRTGDTQTQIIRQALTAPTACVWDGQGDNPMLGMLALADAILVTSDSTNMTVEAASTGKPVYLVDIPGGATKFDLLHESLRKRGIARTFAGEIENWTYEPLNETARVAALLRDKIGLKR